MELKSDLAFVSNSHECSISPKALLHWVHDMFGPLVPNPVMKISVDGSSSTEEPTVLGFVHAMDDCEWSALVRSLVFPGFMFRGKETFTSFAEHRIGEFFEQLRGAVVDGIKPR